MLRQFLTASMVCGGLLVCGTGAAQTPEANVVDVLGNLAGRAGVVFAGEVTAVRPNDGVVEVEFQISESFKGGAAGTYVLREWAGLWAAGQRRYWVGERAVVFLNPAGANGLSSPVDGMDGVLPLTATANGPVDASSEVTAEPAGMAVNVDRLRTRVGREEGAPMAELGTAMSVEAIAEAVNPPAAGTAPAPVKTPLRAPVRRPVPIRYNAPAWPANGAVPVLIASPDEYDFLSFDDDAEKDKDSIAGRKGQKAGRTSDAAR